MTNSIAAVALGVAVTSAAAIYVTMRFGYLHEKAAEHGFFSGTCCVAVWIAYLWLA